jgi:UDP-4-amino-4,6-dideoxy-N-acetyl-beta-L-altrosamine transaminase
LPVAESITMTFIPYGRQCIGDDDIEAVTAVLRGDFLTTGPVVDEFEAELRNRVAASQAVVCSSGTAALHLAMLALDFAPGDVAIVPSMTFAATANAVRYVNGEVIFADVDPATGLMRAGDFEEALGRAGGRKVKAVLPVLLAGQGADAAEIAEIADKGGVAVVEDASHAVGGRYRSRGKEYRVGACGHSLATIFSFHPVKTVAMGEGGAICTNDAAYAQRMYRLRSHGIERDPQHFKDQAAGHDAAGTVNPWYYEIAELGFNYRATDVHCALGLSQLRKIDQFVAKRRALVARYDRLLNQRLPEVQPLARVPGFDAAWHLYAVLIDFAKSGRSRADVMNALRRDGIGTQVHYVPVHRHPYYRDRYGTLSLPGADLYYAQELSLPLYPQLTDQDQDRVVDALSAALHG